MRMKFTLAALASATTLIWVKMAGDNSIKVGNSFSSAKGSCKSRWVFKLDGTLGLYLKNMNEMVHHLIIRDGWNLRADMLEGIYIVKNTTSLFDSCELISGTT